MATTKNSPLLTMKEKFGDKESLVERVLGVIDLGDADREATKKKLLAASNKKLLRLLEVSGEVKTRFGSSEGLAQAAAAAAGKAKDKDYVAKLTRLAQRTPARVLDLLGRTAPPSRAA